MMHIKAVVFDLDGTLYLSKKPYPKAVETVQKVAERLPVYYLSNNTSKSLVFYTNSLLRMGLPLQAKDRILSAMTFALSEIHRRKIRKVHLFANPEVFEWFAAEAPSLDLHPSIEDTELVLVAYHSSFNYRDLCEVAWRLERGADFWVTHADFVCPDEQGPVPDIGSFMALFKAATGREPSRVFGKPNPEMLLPLVEGQNLKPEEILFVGDRLYTDFELAVRAGCRFALVLCGETKHRDVQRLARQPDIIAEQVADIDFDKWIG